MPANTSTAFVRSKTTASNASTFVKAALSGTKILNGRALRAGEFSFTLKDASGNLIETVTNRSDGSFVFSPIEYTAAGIYAYSISEVAGNLGGITYDETVYHVNVYVNDNGYGQRERISDRLQKQV